MTKKISLCLLAACAMLFASQAKAESFSVGDPTYIHNFDTIQEAIDASDPGDYIDVKAGTYNEDLNIDNKPELTITGDVFDSDSVTINGKVNITNHSNVTIQYLVVQNSPDLVSGDDNGIIVRNHSQLSLEFATVENSDYCLIARHGSLVNLNYSKMKNCVSAGIFSKGKKTKVYVYDSNFIDNGIGMKSEPTADFLVSETKFKGNDKALEIINDKTKVKVWENNFIRNDIVFSKHKSKLSKQSNKYSKNTVRYYVW